ncbi:MAG: thermonuclease family protein [Candidatus Aenigmarchaeota archaeon]|nr:thermonuclease family protein [Candidatus Aenigmarchaeota archaeon]
MEKIKAKANLRTVLILFLLIALFSTVVEAISGCCSHHNGVCGCKCCDGTSLSKTCAPYYLSCDETEKEIFSKPDKTTDTIFENEERAKVIRIIDGDTIEVQIGTIIEKIRIIGLDTPETKHPTKGVQCFGKEATEKMTELTKGKTITLEKDHSGDNRGKYGRLLRYVIIEGKDIGLQMVKEGYGISYVKYPHSKIQQYNKAETLAKTNKRGLWAGDTCNGNFLKGDKKESNYSMLQNIKIQKNDSVGIKKGLEPEGNKSFIPKILSFFSTLFFRLINM